MYALRLPRLSARYGSDEDLQASLAVLIGFGGLGKSNSYIAIHALNAIDAVGKKAAPLKDQVAALPTVDPKSPARVNQEYTTRLIDWLKTNL